MNSREFIKMLLREGWYLDRTNGSHHQFKHPTRKGRVTVIHPTKDFKIKTWNEMLKQAGLK